MILWRGLLLSFLSGHFPSASFIAYPQAWQMVIETAPGHDLLQEHLIFGDVFLLRKFVIRQLRSFG